jgi:quercetin dioxygenase-like cupin family protein
MSVYRPLAEMPLLPIWDGIRARVVEGREMTFAIVELDPGATAAKHEHANEQIGLVLKGSITFTVGDETRQLSVGDTYEIAGRVPHEATAGPEGAVVIDVFAPVRADWGALDAGDPQPPRWP